VKISNISIFHLLFQVFNYDFIIYVHLGYPYRKVKVIDDVENSSLIEYSTPTDNILLLLLHNNVYENSCASKPHRRVFDTIRFNENSEVVCILNHFVCHKTNCQWPHTSS